MKINRSEVHSTSRPKPFFNSVEKKHSVSQGKKSNQTFFNPQIFQPANYHGGKLSQVPVSGVLQRKPTPEAPTATAEQPVESPGTPPAATAKAAGRTTNITFSANYNEVPGKGRNVVKSRMDENALWFAPLSVSPHVPEAPDGRKQQLTGVVAGTGESRLGTIAVPVTESEPSFGRGSITPSLRFASALSRSVKVKVSFDSKGSKNTAAQRARSFVLKELQLTGDIEQVKTAAAAHLKSEYGYENPRVEIDLLNNRTNQIGMSTIYYRVRKNPTILMEIEAKPAGERVTTSGSSKTVGAEGEVEKERHGDQSVETVEARRSKVVTDVLEDLIKRVDTVRKKIIAKLWHKLNDNKKFGSKTKWKYEEEKVKTIDLTEKLKRDVEKGQKKKQNWAAKAKGIVGKVNDIISIPFVEKIPGIGWGARKLKKWRLGLVEKGLDLFAKERIVDYLDEKANKTTKGKIKQNTDGSGEATTKGHSEREVRGEADFIKTVKEDSRSEWTRFRKRVISIKEDYFKITRKASSGGSDRFKLKANQSTTVTFSGTTTWKYTKPQIKATVVKGDGDVSSTPFTTPKAPEETYANANAPNPNTPAADTSNKPELDSK